MYKMSKVRKERLGEAVEKLLPVALELLGDEEKIALLEKNALGMALREAGQIIADEVYSLV